MALSGPFSEGRNSGTNPNRRANTSATISSVFRESILIFNGHRATLLGGRLLQVEGIDKVMQRIGGTHPIAHVYPQLVLLVLIHSDPDFNYVNTRFPIYQCFFHTRLYESHSRCIE